MSACKNLVRLSLSSPDFNVRSNLRKFSLITIRNLHSFSGSNNPSRLLLTTLICPKRGLGRGLNRVSSISYGCVHAAVSRETADGLHETTSSCSILEPLDDWAKDNVQELISDSEDVARLMKMERRSGIDAGEDSTRKRRWFPYLDMFKSGGTFLTSREVLEAVDAYILDVRKERIRNVAMNRSYSVCLVVEGLSDFGNVSAAFRSADALGVQSVHVVSCDSSKRYRENRHVSMGAEKWLDIELWDSIQECFQVLKSRGYRIATTHVGTDAVSIYDMDWSWPTAIVVGNESRGISDEALQLSDLHCNIPMKGMVDSFNVSVAAGILMHHAVCDRTSRLGCPSDLTPEESQILHAELSLRHSKNTISIANEYAKRKAGRAMPKL
ncbi:hypothetical protein NE237_006757 [Protea cynaroides]|uniref:tRNA/rRNA methyltransferase SpoU type domain-containing protein n=1 Tax=Protea cynaroides TaxID=273540 RepID=A0A9Q0KN05_9MAGN|nr:hypothetical protein NE237_006757 [Protea cynaroides]